MTNRKRKLHVPRGFCENDEWNRRSQVGVRTQSLILTCIDNENIFGHGIWDTMRFEHRLGLLRLDVLSKRRSPSCAGVNDNGVE